MKVAFVLLTMMFSLSVRAQSVPTDERQTERLIAMLSSLDSSFSSGTNQGSKSYGAQMECSNTKGDQNPETMNCFIRTLAGFSVNLQTPVQVTGVLASDLKLLMGKNKFSYMITNEVFGLGGKITCVDNSAVGDGVSPVPNSCEISRVF